MDAPDGLKIRLMAAYERGQPATFGSRLGSLRFALLSGATAAAVVLAAGVAVRGPGPAAAESPGWVAIHPLPTAEPRVRVQDDARLAFGGTPSAVAMLEPLEGP